MEDLTNEGLREWYSDIAANHKHAIREREASMLYSVAQGELLEDQADSGLESAYKALDIFRELGNSHGIVDSLRVIISCLRQKGSVDTAAELAMEEYNRFSAACHRFGEASMMLMLCEICADAKSARNVNQALRYGLEARHLFRDFCSDEELEANTMLALIGVYHRVEQGDEAVELSLEALQMFRKLGDRRGEAKALHGQALGNAMIGQTGAAMKAATQAREIFADLGLRRLEGGELIAMAKFNYDVQDFAKVAAVAEEAANLFEEIEDERGEAAAINLSVAALAELKETEKGFEMARSALERFESTGYTRGQATTQDVLVSLHLAAGEEDEALKAAESALKAMRDLGDKRLQAGMLYEMAKIYLKQKELDKARESIVESMALMEEIGEDKILASAALQTLTEVQQAYNDWGDALRTVDESMRLFKNVGDRAGEAAALSKTAEIHLKMQQVPEAVQALQAAQQIYKELGEAGSLVKNLFMLAKMQLGFNQPEEALRLAKQAQIICSRTKDAEGEIDLLLFMAKTTIAVVENRVSQEGLQRDSQEFRDLGEKGLALASQARKLAKRLNDVKLQGCCWFQVAEHMMLLGEFQDALKSIAESIKLFRDCEHQGPGLGEAAALILKGQILYFNGRTDPAVDSINEGLEMARECEDTEEEQNALAALQRIQGSKSSKQVDEAEEDYAIQDEAGGAKVATSTAASAVVEAKPKGLDPIEVNQTVLSMLNDLIGVEVDNDTPFMDAGVDSLLSIEFRSGIVKQFAGLSLGTTLTFDYPTVKALSDHIVERSNE